MSQRSLILLLACLLVASVGLGATFTSTAAGGDWNNPTSWTAGSGFPVATDAVIIVAGATININVSAACSTLSNSGTLNFPTNNLNLAVGSDMTMSGTSQVTGSNNNRVLNVAGNFNVPFGAIAIIGGVQMNITGTTNISGYFEFGVSGTGNKTFNGTITVNAGGTWDNLVGEDPFINCNIVNNGNWPASSGGTGIYRVNTSGISYTYSGNSSINMSELRLNTAGTGTVTNLGTLIINGNGVAGLTVGTGRSFVNGNGSVAATVYINAAVTLINAGTMDFTKALNTVNYNFAGAQNIFSTTYYNLATSNSGVKTLSGNTTVTNQVSVSNTSILDVGANTLDGTASLVMTNTGEIRLAKTGVALPELTGTANSLAAGTTITLNGAATQFAKVSSAVNPSTTNSYPYQNININGTNASSAVDLSNVNLVNGNLTFANLGSAINNPVLTVLGTFNFGAATASTTLTNDIIVGDILLTAGTLNYSNRNITVNGNGGAWTNNGGVSFINTLSSVTFTTGANQKIKGTTSTVFNNLIINNSNGVSLSGVDAQVTGTLTLTTGNLITLTRGVYVTGTVTRTTGFVEGNLQKDVSSGSPSPTFEVGTGTIYAPVSLTFTGISAGGTIKCSSTGTPHPLINSSNLEPTKSVTRYWTLSNTSLTYTSFNATFNFGAGETGSGNPLNFVTKWTTTGIAWNLTTTGTRTATSTQFTGEPSSTLPGSATSVVFACGEQIVTTGFLNRVTGTTNSWNNKATWIQNRTGTITFNGTTAVSGVNTLFTTELVAGASGDFIMLQTTAGTVQGQVQSITDDTHLTLFSASVSSASGGYGRERIPNAIGDAVTIGNSNLTDATTTIQYDMPSATLINSLNLNTSTSPRNTAQSLTHSNANLLTVQTNVNINQPATAVTDLWDIAAGQVLVSGTLTIGSSINANNQIAKVNLSTGTLSVGNIFFNVFNSNGVEAATVLNMTGAATVSLSGLVSFGNNRGLITPGTTSTFNFNGTSAQTLVFPSSNTVTFSYANLTFNNSSGSGVLVSPPGQDLTATNVTGNVAIQSGSLVTSDNTDITGAAGKTFSISNGATFRMTGASSTFPTGFSGGISLGTTSTFGTVSYEQTTAVSITNVTYGHLKLLSSGSSAAAYSITNPGFTVNGNLTIGDGSSNPTVAELGATGANLTVIGNILINSNATLNAILNNRIRAINIGGNWTNNGTFTPSTTTADTGLNFTGAGPSQPQVIGGTTADTFFRMVINTSSATNIVQLAKSISIANSGNSRLTLTQGGFDLNGNTLNLLNNANTLISGGATGAYIKSENTSAPYGSITWSIGTSAATYVFPFGKSSTQYIPVTYQVTAAGSPAASTVSVSTYATATNNTPLPTTVTNLTGTSGGNSVTDRFWVVSTTGYATTKPIGTFTFTAVGTDAIPPSEKPGSIPSIAAVTPSPAGIAGQRWNVSGYWDTALPSQTFANNVPNAGFFQVTVPAVTVSSFSPWALADASIPLPITLKSFTAFAQSDRVNIEWYTETEINNALFTVQKTFDGESFKDVAELPGAGTTAQAKSYHVADVRPAAGRWYYRLKQTDYDGVFTYSKLVAVDVADGLAWVVFPNPSNGTLLNVQFGQNDLGKDANIKIQDMGGKEILLATKNLNSTDLKIEMPQSLSPGIYIISIIVDQNVVRQKLVVR